MRTFIAIDLPEELKKKLSEFQDELKKQDLVAASWTSDYHLTLKFLGEVNEKKLEEIKKNLENICKKTKSFKLELKGIGTFPSEKYIRVLWIGADIGDKQAKDLQKEIDSELVNLSFEKEKRYANHLTLARVKAVKDKNKLKELFEKYKDKSFGTFTVDKIKLMKSTLTPKGSVYETLKEFRLA